MNKSVAIEIRDDKVLNLIHSLEDLGLIKILKIEQSQTTNWVSRYKGAMSKQSMDEIDAQLNTLRNEWD